MDIKKFKQLRESYNHHIGRGKSGRDKNGEKVTHQTQSVWFDRKTIQELLDQTDENSGGIKMFFGEYDSETAGEVQDIDDPRELVGRLTVILSASNDNEDPSEKTMIRNGGKI